MATPAEILGNLMGGTVTLDVPPPNSTPVDTSPPAQPSSVVTQSVGAQNGATSNYNTWTEMPTNNYSQYLAKMAAAQNDPTSAYLVGSSPPLTETQWNAAVARAAADQANGITFGGGTSGGNYSVPSSVVGGYPSGNAIITPAVAIVSDIVTQTVINNALTGKNLMLGFLNNLGTLQTYDTNINLQTPIFLAPASYSITSYTHTAQWGWHSGDYPADIWVIPVATSGDNTQNYVTTPDQAAYNDFYIKSVEKIAAQVDPSAIYRNIGLTRHDADILYLLQTGAIKRSAVKANSPLLDKILYNPGYPDRLPATPSPEPTTPVVPVVPPIVPVVPPTVPPTVPVVPTTPQLPAGLGVPDEPPEPTLLQALKVPVTAAMLTGLFAIEKVMTTRELIASPMMPALNSGDYRQALGQVNVLTKGDSTTPVISNPQALIDQMRADGIPSDDCAITETGYATTARPYINPTNTPGFSDPNGKYPSVTQEGSSSRLVRAQSVTRSILTKKIAARVMDVRTANKFEWSQPKNSYAAVYPFNQVRQTESGHLQEFDDTPGAERIHTYHRSGTYEEIDPNGSRINRIVGDDFEILERNGHVLIKGSCNVTVMGDSRLRIERDAWIDVKGNIETKVLGNMKAQVDGLVDIDTLSTCNVSAKDGISVVTKDNISVTAGGNINIGAVGDITMIAANIHLNPGGSATTPVFRMPQQYTERPMPRFTDLVVTNKDSEIVANYEVPEEGSGKEFQSKLDSLGIDSKTQAETRMTEKDTKAPVTKAAEPVVAPVDDIAGCTVFTPAFQLSPNFTLKMLTESECGGPTNDPVIIDNLRNLAVNCLEPILKRYPNLKITSGYRKIVPKGGSKTSDHLDGNAADFKLTGYTRAQMRDACVEIGKLLPAFTQLILEYRGASNWIHVAYSRKKGAKMSQFTMNNDKTLAQGFVLVA